MQQKDEKSIVVPVVVLGTLGILTLIASSPNPRAHTPLPVPNHEEAVSSLPHLNEFSVDAIRISKEGTVTLAGRASENGDIVLLLDEREVYRENVGLSQDYAFVVSLPTAPKQQALTVKAEWETHEETFGDVFLINPIVEKSIVEQDVAARVQEELNTLQDTSLTDLGLISASVGNVDFDIQSIKYEKSGLINVGGIAAPNSRVNLEVIEAGGSKSYMPAINVVSDNEGFWSAFMDIPSAGLYDITAFEETVARDDIKKKTIPFERVDPGEINGLLISEDMQQITVQPGATLWAISSDQYGTGVEYKRIYNRNKSKISDPNLIYPGQIFILD